MKSGLLTIFAVGLMSATAAGAADGNIDDLRYSRTDWNPGMIRLYEEIGPKIQAPDTPFDMTPFPANSSEETKAELEALKEMANQERTPEQVRKIHIENESLQIFTMYSAYGLYDADTHPLTNSLLQSVDSDVVYFVVREKLRFERPRPFQLIPEWKTVIETPKHSAYPSGHAAQSYAAALILSKLDPAKTEDYMQLARDIGHRREIAGVHYPSDTVAGQKLAEQIVNKLLDNQTIQKRMAMAKKEFETQPENN